MIGFPAPDRRAMAARAQDLARQLIEYYVSVAPVVLAHIRDRPLTMKRYPDGVAKKYFYEKHVPSHAPSWVRTVRVPVAEGGETEADEQDIPVPFLLRQIVLHAVADEDAAEGGDGVGQGGIGEGNGGAEAVAGEQ